MINNVFNTSSIQREKTNLKFDVNDFFKLYYYFVIIIFGCQKVLKVAVCKLYLRV